MIATYKFVREIIFKKYLLLQHLEKYNKHKNYTYSRANKRKSIKKES